MPVGAPRIAFAIVLAAAAALRGIGLDKPLYLDEIVTITVAAQPLSSMPGYAAAPDGSEVVFDLPVLNPQGDPGRVAVEFIVHGLPSNPGGVDNKDGWTSNPRAVYAALRMQDGARRLREGLGRGQGREVQLRIGLNSGEVVVRSGGSDLPMDYTAVGQTTYLAAQMERLARPGATLLTAETARLAEGYLEARPLDPVTVKGIAEPVAVFELIGPGPARHRLQAATVRGLSRFIGRD